MHAKWQTGDTNASSHIRIRRIRRIRNAPRSIRHPSAAIVAAGLQVHVAAHLGDASSKGLPGWDIREPELPRGEPRKNKSHQTAQSPFHALGRSKHCCLSRPPQIPLAMVLVRESVGLVFELKLKQEGQYELGNAHLLCLASEYFGCQNRRASPKRRVSVGFSVPHPLNGCGSKPMVPFLG